MGSKLQPGKFDCYANAEPDEPMFVLLARDELAGVLVTMWGLLRIGAFDKLDECVATLKHLARRYVDAPDNAKANEAAECANAMTLWIDKNRPGKLRGVMTSDKIRQEADAAKARGAVGKKDRWA